MSRSVVPTFVLSWKNCFALTNLYTTTTTNNSNSTFYNAPAALHNSDGKNRVGLRKEHQNTSGCVQNSVIRICVHVRVYVGVGGSRGQSCVRFLFFLCVCVRARAYVL